MIVAGVKTVIATPKYYGGNVALYVLRDRIAEHIRLAKSGDNLPGLNILKRISFHQASTDKSIGEDELPALIVNNVQLEEEAAKAGASKESPAHSLKLKEGTGATRVQRTLNVQFTLMTSTVKGGFTSAFENVNSPRKPIQAPAGHLEYLSAIMDAFEIDPVSKEVDLMMNGSLDTPFSVTIEEQDPNKISISTLFTVALRSSFSHRGGRMIEIKV